MNKNGVSNAAPYIIILYLYVRYLADDAALLDALDEGVPGPVVRDRQTQRVLGLPKDR